LLAAGLVLVVVAAALDKRVAGASDRCGAAIWWQPRCFPRSGSETAARGLWLTGRQLQVRSELIWSVNGGGKKPSPCLVPQFFPKFHYAKRGFLITLKCRQMHGVLNVDEIKN
jgi:hypothetical protein